MEDIKEQIKPTTLNNQQQLFKFSRNTIQELWAWKG